MSTNRKDNLVFFADTDSDITPEIAKECGFELISMPYSVGDVDYYPYESFTEFDSSAFYNMLRKGTIPSTFTLNEEKYYETFKPFFADGKDILYVHFSRNMTGTFNSMDRAVEKLKAEYPDRNFYAIDTKGITAMSYIVVREIGDLYNQNKTIDEILDWAKTEVDKYQIFFTADNLTFFARSGRVSKLKAGMGNLIGLKPIMHMDSNGKMVALGAARGKKLAIARILEMVEEIQENIADHRIVIGHTDAMEYAELAKEALVEKYGPNLNIEFVVVNPTAGSHCGPDAIGITFHSRCKYDLK